MRDTAVLLFVGALSLVVLAAVLELTRRGRRWLATFEAAFFDQEED